MCDDDVVAKTYSLSAKEGGIKVAGHVDERDVGYCWNRDAALAALMEDESDLLHEHERLLGWSLSDLADTNRMSLDTACDHMLDALAFERQPFICRATYAGIVGDCSEGHPAIAMTAPQVKGRLASGEEVCRAALESREGFRVARQAIVMHGPQCMAYCMALLNSECMVPFMPKYRNEDGMFAQMLSLADPGTMYGHLTSAVVHDSDRPASRERTPDVAAQVGISDVLSTVLRERMVGRTPAFRSLADAAMELARMDTREVSMLVSEATVAANCAVLANVRDEAPAVLPEYLGEVIRSYRDEMIKEMETGPTCIPLEFRGLASRGEQMASLHAFIRELADVLAAWPAMWDVAADQRAGRGHWI
jgi:hypothetical protein